MIERCAALLMRSAFQLRCDPAQRVVELIGVPVLCDVQCTEDDFRQFLAHLDTLPTATSSFPTSAASVASASAPASLPMSQRPPAFLKILHSKACRSAIMFGDALAPDQRNALIGKFCFFSPFATAGSLTAECVPERLSKCRFPFNCAHGRPTMTPLLELPAVSPSRKVPVTPLLDEPALVMISSYAADTCTLGIETILLSYPTPYRSPQKVNPLLFFLLLPALHCK